MAGPLRSQATFGVGAQDFGRAGAASRNVLKKMRESAGNAQVIDLVSWALPIQQGRFEGALAGSNKLASQEDPNAAN